MTAEPKAPKRANLRRCGFNSRRLGRKGERMILSTKKPVKRTAVIALSALALLIIAALAVYLFRDKIFDSGGGLADPSSAPYTYEYGAKAQYALMGKRLAVSSSTGLQLLDSGGYTDVRQIFSSKNPALSATDDACVFYDIGGTALRFYSVGELINLDTEGNIISASLSRSGHLTVSYEKLGYKGALTVYDKSGKPAFEWYSGNGYLLDAAVSPGGDAIAVLCLEASGSVIHLFQLKSDIETGAISLPNELAFKLGFTGNGSFCVLSESAMHFYNTGAAELGSFSFGDMNLMDFLITEDICIVSLSKYISGSTVTLTSLSSEGREIGSAELDYAPLSISPGKQKLLVLGSGSVTVFSKDLSVISQTDTPAAYSDAVFLPDGSALLLSSYHGEKISVN